VTVHGYSNKPRRAHKKVKQASKQAHNQRDKLSPRAIEYQSTSTKNGLAEVETKNGEFAA
jgi:hypothetical protein